MMYPYTSFTADTNFSSIFNCSQENFNGKKASTLKNCSYLCHFIKSYN